jgi:SAM-dependent methyltransferase
VTASRDVTATAADEQLSPRLESVQALLVCPACHGLLRWSERVAECPACALMYPVEDGIPVLVDRPDRSGHDELEHDHAGVRHKDRQAAHFDLIDAAEFEIERPRGSPGLYGWLLREKFRRATTDLGADLTGRTAVVVCGGSGMDAEFLAGRGLRVITTDISIGAARRARERASRHGLDYVSVVADVEHLPFADRSVDLVFVHDGLHHLERPMAGLHEMARCSAWALSVTEPAKAAATALAVRLGWALRTEEAGNAVMRLTLADVGDALQADGFNTRRSERYAMFYRHRPGPIFRALSWPVLTTLVTRAWRVANTLIGRIGNKMVVVATRRATDLGG